MRTCEYEPTRHSCRRLLRQWRALALLLASLGPASGIAGGQAASQDSVSVQIEQLTQAMARTQAQLEQSQRQLDEMRRQLSALQRQVGQNQPPSATPAATVSQPDPVSTSSPQTASGSASDSLQQIREQQAMLESQVATHEQTKVESESKYPVKITGLLLLNGFVNTRGVDMAATPTEAIHGPGSTGATLRQTILGVDARGPHLFGARSYADLRVDFDGSPLWGSSTTGYSGYDTANTTLLRLRTAHAGLQWQHSEAYLALDRPIFSPDTPTSLTAVAEPALAWSGNLWTWNPELGASHDFASEKPLGLRLQAALIDVGDAPLSQLAGSTANATSAEQSRWPGVEARLALLGSEHEDGRNQIGVGGFFATHNSRFLGHHFDSWAATLDTRVYFPARLQLSGSFYRGLALGGLGGGGYKDFAYSYDAETGGYYFRALDDVGGWVQLKEKFSERLQLNGAVGMDNVFAGELQPFAVRGAPSYENLARNRTFTGNVIYSPSAYLQFSLEYRRLESFPLIYSPWRSDIIGLGAGYSF